MTDPNPGNQLKSCRGRCGRTPVDPTSRTAEVEDAGGSACAVTIARVDSIAANKNGPVGPAGALVSRGPTFADQNLQLSIDEQVNLTSTMRPQTAWTFGRFGCVWRSITMSETDGLR